MKRGTLGTAKRQEVGRRLKYCACFSFVQVHKT